MRTRDIPDVSQLTLAEKILLVEDLWDSIASEESEMSIPQSHRDELDERRKQYQANPGNLMTLEELQGRIAKRK